MSAPTAHPAWCSDVHCDVGQSDVRHGGWPDRLFAADVQVLVGLVQHDEHGRPQVAGVELQLLHTALETNAGEPLQVAVELTASEADDLALVLTAHAARARRAAAAAGIPVGGLS